jgi:hypothetical protein
MLRNILFAMFSLPEENDSSKLIRAHYPAANWWTTLHIRCMLRGIGCSRPKYFNDPGVPLLTFVISREDVLLLVSE